MEYYYPCNINCNMSASSGSRFFKTILKAFILIVRLREKKGFAVSLRTLNPCISVDRYLSVCSY